MIDECGFPYAHSQSFILGNGELAQLDAFEGVVHWHGREIELKVLETDGNPLIGMKLLEGSRLIIDVLDGGDVTVEEI